MLPRIFFHFAAGWILSKWCLQRNVRKYRRPLFITLRQLKLLKCSSISSSSIHRSSMERQSKLHSLIRYSSNKKQAAKCVLSRFCKKKILCKTKLCIISITFHIIEVVGNFCLNSFHIFLNKVDLPYKDKASTSELGKSSIPRSFFLLLTKVSEVKCLLASTNTVVFSGDILSKTDFIVSAIRST